MDDDDDFGFGSNPPEEEEEDVSLEDGDDKGQDDNQPVAPVVVSPSSRTRTIGSNVGSNDATPNANSGTTSVDLDSSDDDSSDDEQPSPSVMTTTNTSDTTSSSSSSKRRRRFTVAQKLKYVRAINQKMRDENISQRAAAAFFNIDNKQVITWKKQIPELSFKGLNKKAKSLCKGRFPLLRTIENDLLQFIFARREQGMAVTINMVVLKASQLNREFRDKTKVGKYNSVRRFVRHHSFVHRMSTHESQRAPAETTAEATDWILSVAHPKVSQPNRHQDYIINMDQTPLPFDNSRARTLSVSGARTVPVQKSTNDTKRATFAMTVTASGKILKPMLIFKGTPAGRIVQRELPTFPDDMIYTCQSNAWMDEPAMLHWVDEILRPYVAEAPDGVIPILFLDSYRCHMMASVVEAIQELGVDVEHIPGGCTYLCQPVDVGVNKPFKTRVRNEWEDWMVAEGLATNTTAPPKQIDIANWAIKAFKAIPEEMVRNAWRHGSYSWFPQPPDEQHNEQQEQQQIAQV